MAWQWVPKNAKAHGQRGALVKTKRSGMQPAAKLQSHKKPQKVMQVKKSVVTKHVGKPALVKTLAGTAGKAPDKTARQRVSAARVTGKLIKYNGTMGWIKSSQPAKHKDANKRGGNIFLHTDDVQNGHEMKQGVSVSFFVYCDEQGLGAEHAMVVSASEAAAPTKFKAAAQAVAGKLKASKPSVQLAGRAAKIPPKQATSAPAGTKYGCEVCKKQFAGFAAAAACERVCKAKQSAVVAPVMPRVTTGPVKPQGNTYACEICKKAFPSYAIAANCEKACKAKKVGVKSSVSKPLGAGAGKPRAAGATVYSCDLCHKSFPIFASAATCEKSCKLKKSKGKPGLASVAVKQTAFNKGKMQKMVPRRF